MNQGRHENKVLTSKVLKKKEILIFKKPKTKTKKIMVRTFFN